MLMASKNRDNCTTEPPPKMLKEFLQELNNNPHRQSHPLPRTRSSRSRTAVTSFQKLISSAIKSLRRGSSVSTLPRSLSTSLLDRFSVNKKNNDDKVKVKVKDILRWRSSRDLVEEASQPLDVSSVITNVDDERISIAASSDNSHLFGSELEYSLGEKEETCFTADKLPCWWGNSRQESKLWDQDNDVVATVSHVGSEEELQNMNMEDGKEQHSPVSVLNSPFREEIDSPFSEEISDEEFVSSFDKSLANMERTKQRLLQSIRSFESLAGVFEDDDDDETEIVQAIQQERGDKVRIIIINNNEIEVKSREYLSRAIGKITWKSQDLKDREDCIKFMEEEQGQWSKFEEKKRELGVELEVQVLSDLVDEVLIDHFG